MEGPAANQTVGWVPPEAAAPAAPAAAPAWAPPEAAAPTHQPTAAELGYTETGRAEPAYPLETLLGMGGGKIASKVLGLIAQGLLKKAEPKETPEQVYADINRQPTQTNPPAWQSAPGPQAPGPTQTRPPAWQGTQPKPSVQEAVGGYLRGGTEAAGPSVSPMQSAIAQGRSASAPKGEVSPMPRVETPAVQEPAPAASVGAQNRYVPAAANRRPAEEIAKPETQVQAQKRIKTAMTEKLFRSIHGQESGGGTKHIPANYTGAQGPMQIKPETFAQFARGNERVDNPADNIKVGKRILAAYLEAYNYHPGRAAVAYYSGPGNVSFEGPVPWKKDIKPKVGPRVSQYVAEVVGRLSSIKTA